jgi:23S rRNA (uracil1939-C5)-methyltransferase
VTVELTIRELAAGGDGVGRGPDGRVVFVPFTAPGDRVRVRVSDTRSSYARGSVEALLSAGPSRTDPVCAVFGSCGGCAWQHVEYAAQLDAKVAIVESALKRIGGLAPPAVPITPSPDPYGYRSRSRVLVSGGRVGYRRRRSHALCATDRCPLLAEPLAARLLAWGAGDEPPPADGDWELALGFEGSDSQPTARVARVPSAPERRLWLQVGADRIAFSEGAFVQSNASMLDFLLEAVVAAAGSGRRAYDLFAGAGFWTLGLAREFDSVVAVEANPVAADDLAFNLTAAAIDNVEVVAEPVERAVEDNALTSRPPDVIVLDPPRSGLPERVAETLAGLAPQRFVYLSCNPATLARDLSTLAFWGYQLTSTQAFDLFPQTPHVEVLAIAERP